MRFQQSSKQSFTNACHCLGPIEMKFPDHLRIKICGRSLNDRFATLREDNKGKPAGEKIIYCDKNLQSTPHGILPGIW